MTKQKKPKTKEDGLCGINPKTIDSFLKSQEAEKTAKASKDLFASKIIEGMKKQSITTLTHKNKNITLCVNKQYQYDETIETLNTELKKQQEHARIDGNITIKSATDFLKVTDKKEPTQAKQVQVGKKLA